MGAFNNYVDQILITLDRVKIVFICQTNPFLT